MTAPHMPSLMRYRYFSLFTVYTPYTIYQYGFKGWFKMIYRDGWKCILNSSTLPGLPLTSIL